MSKRAVLYFFLIIITSLLTTKVNAENCKIDSLLTVLSKPEIDTAKKADLLIKVFELKLNANAEDAIDYIDKAIRISEKNNLYQLAGEANFRKAMMYFFENDFIKTEEYCNKSINNFTLAKDSAGIAKSVRRIGVVNLIRGDFVEALQYTTRALSIYENIYDTIGISSTLNDLGIFHDKQGDSEKALEYYLEAIDMRILAGKEHTTAQLLNNVAIIYARNEEYDKALEYFNESLKYAKEVNQTELQGALYLNIGKIYDIKGNYTRAGNYYMLSLEIKKQTPDYWGRAYLYNSIGENLKNQGKFNLAYEAYNKSLSICEDLAIKDLTKENYLGLAKLMAESENFESALNYHKKYTESLKEFLDEERQKTIAEIQSEFDDKRKADKIEMLTNEKLLREAQLQRNRIFIIVLIVVISLAILFCVLAIVAYKEKSRVYRIAETINNELEERVTAELQENRKKDVMLAQQNKQAVMGEMINSIANQWRQPLSSIALIIQNIEEAHSHNDLKQEYLKEKVKKSMDLINLMDDIINDFRYFFKTNQNKEHFSVIDAVSRTLRFSENILAKQGITVIKQIEDDVFANGYSNEYSQTILNILNNSKEALIENQVEDAWIKIVLEEKNKKSLLTIEDNAGGIELQDKNQVFEPYYTTKEKSGNTGLGLYLSKIMIEKNMDGKLTVTNTDFGAKFYILL